MARDLLKQLSIPKLGMLAFSVGLRRLGGWLWPFWSVHSRLTALVGWYLRACVCDVGCLRFGSILDPHDKFSFCFFLYPVA